MQSQPLISTPVLLGPRDGRVLLLGLTISYAVGRYQCFTDEESEAQRGPRDQAKLQALFSVADRTSSLSPRPPSWAGAEQA